MERQRIIADIDRAFAQTFRPGTFLRDPKHCETCAAHDAQLRKLTPQTVRLRHFDLSGRDGANDISDAAFKYFMPGLVRHVLSGPEGGAADLFLRLLERRIDALEHDQFRAVTALVDYLCNSVPTAASGADE